jgi:hypothetical protein
MITMTTPINIGNIRKYEVLKWIPREDDNWGEIILAVYGAGSVLYGLRGEAAPWSLVIQDTAGSNRLELKQTVIGYDDIIVLGVNSQTGAFSALLAADKAVTGNRAAHRRAVEALLVERGVLTAAFAGS